MKTCQVADSFLPGAGDHFISQRMGEANDGKRIGWKDALAEWQ